MNHRKARRASNAPSLDELVQLGAGLSGACQEVAALSLCLRERIAEHKIIVLNTGESLKLGAALAAAALAGSRRLRRLLTHVGADRHEAEGSDDAELGFQPVAAMIAISTLGASGNRSSHGPAVRWELHGWHGGLGRRNGGAVGGATGHKSVSHGVLVRVFGRFAGHTTETPWA